MVANLRQTFNISYKIKINDNIKAYDETATADLKYNKGEQNISRIFFS